MEDVIAPGDERLESFCTDIGVDMHDVKCIQFGVVGGARMGTCRVTTYARDPDSDMRVFGKENDEWGALTNMQWIWVDDDRVHEWLKREFGVTVRDLRAPVVVSAESPIHDGERVKIVATISTFDHPDPVCTQICSMP